MWGESSCFNYSRTPLFRTRLIRSPRYFERRSNSLGFTLMFSVIYYQLFRTRLFRIPRYFEVIVLSLHLKSTPLFRTSQKQSTYITKMTMNNKKKLSSDQRRVSSVKQSRLSRATVCLLLRELRFEGKQASCHSRSTKVLEKKNKTTEHSRFF